MNHNWLYKIQQHEATPPQGAWKNIASTLDQDAGFVAKLTAYETDAPVIAEKNIFALLDAGENTSFEKKIYNYKTEAPQTAWSNIVTELHRREGKVVSIENNRRKINPVYVKIAAAVFIIAMLSISAWFLQKPKQEISEPVAGVNQQPSLQNNNEVKSNNAAEKIPAAETTPTPVNIASDFPAKQSTATAPVLAYVQHNQTEVLAQNPAAFAIDKLQNTDGITPQDITLINSAAANSYVTITGPDGEPVRVSSKFAAFINYLNDNPETTENIELIIKESAKWRATFAAWKEKMINNSIAPSLTNFMDIIELSNVLEEKK